MVLPILMGSQVDGTPWDPTGLRKWLVGEYSSQLTNCTLTRLTIKLHTKILVSPNWNFPILIVIFSLTIFMSQLTTINKFFAAQQSTQLKLEIQNQTWIIQSNVPWTKSCVISGRNQIKASFTSLHDAFPVIQLLNCRHIKIQFHSHSHSPRSETHTFCFQLIMAIPLKFHGFPKFNSHFRRVMSWPDLKFKLNKRGK